MNKRQTGEIDLLELIAGFFMSLKRNLILSIALPAAGILVAAGISSQSRDVFESTMMIETSLLTEDECKFLFEQLEKYGVIPGLSKEEDNQVLSFSFQVTRNDGPVLPEQNSYLLNRSVYLGVTARVFDTAVFPKLQQALVNFIDQSPSVHHRRSERQKFYSEMIGKIDSEIAAMDDVKKQMGGKAQATYLDPSELFASSVKLYEKRTEYEIRLKETNSIHLLKGFDTLTINARIGLITASLIGFSVGFLVLCFLLLLRSFFQFYKRYETTH